VIFELPELIAHEFHMMTCERENRLAYLQLRTLEAVETAMARFREAHVELMQAELDFYAKRDMKKQASTSQGEVGPSPITIESSDEEMYITYWESIVT
jgi:hypothetical protein